MGKISTSAGASELDELCINTIRMVAADGVERAKSGHPGLPMGAAAFAYTLWTRHVRFNPHDPGWLNRDRFVLSAGHGSMLLYSLLHLTGYDLPLDELKQFRQWGSLTPGHPEHGLTPGVETSTGPLGQGAANAVGMALAEQFLADRYNRSGHKLIDYHTYALVSDGDLMEGVSAEAASFAGGLKLGKLVWLYDSNRISIEGSTDVAFRDDTAVRFAAYGWHVVTVADGNDVAAVDTALTAAQAETGRPSLIILHTHIGFGSPGKHDSAAAHGSPLGAEELAKTKANLGWPAEPDFYIPEEVLAHMRQAVGRGVELQATWEAELADYQKAFPELAAELRQQLDGKLPAGWDADLPAFTPDDGPLASREASGAAMNAIAAKLPLFVGGSADLGPSNNTALKDFGDITGDGWPTGARNLHFGVREHAMGGILNGLALTPGLRPFGATFLVFSDYMRGAIRLAALMRLPVTYVFTHDSIGQGEDGATHQPIEHLASLRAMPGLTVIRPSDATETVEAWRQAISADGPTALVLTRQKLPIIDRSVCAPADNLRFGAYIIKDCSGEPALYLVATGSEVPLALEAAEALAKQGLAVRVISLPSTELFARQSKDYQLKILPPDGAPRLIIEAASSFGWSKYLRPQDATLTIDEFGASAPGPVMMEKFGFTVDNVVARAKKLLRK